jgi:hypothetical protein
VVVLWASPPQAAAIKMPLMSPSVRMRIWPKVRVRGWPEYVSPGEAGSSAHK